MPPQEPLPYNPLYFSDANEYVGSLLELVTSNELLRTLCGGVHILDFFTSDPDLYSRILPAEWREFFSQHTIMDTLDLLLRHDVDHINTNGRWADTPVDLINYIRMVRRHLLQRQMRVNQCAKNRAMKQTQKLTRNVAVGMTIKKVHEVGLFSSYIDRLASEISESTGQPLSHLVDFGSGQNYLGRALASEPYNRSIVAIESKSSNAEKAKEFDIQAKLVERQKFMRNKKAFKAGLEGPGITIPEPVPTPHPEDTTPDARSIDESAALDIQLNGASRIQYVEHRIQDGDLSSVIQHVSTETRKSLMVMSLHSCGNLVHHGLRSLVLNPSVKVVAMVGCCYNLLTERLGPATYKLPELRPTTYSHPRLEKTGEANDPNGFPMSQRFCEFRSESNGSSQFGVRLNITARMMAVQAPLNWGEKDSADFFTRHFFRAVLQRIFLDRGVVGPPSPDCVGGSSAAGHSSGGTPIILGSLRKSCYNNFVSYVRGAQAKLVNDPVLGSLIKEKMDGITDEDISMYEQRYAERKKDLSVIWSLMAFSAGVIEAAIVVDRWLWLKEQSLVKDAWVEPVFDYTMSPRNLVVVGVKK